MEKISKNFQNTLFNDAELKTSKHDEIIMFAYNNIEEILEQIMSDSYYLENHKNFGFDLLKSKYAKIRLDRKILEKPLTSANRQYINGFIDLCIRYSYINEDYEIKNFIDIYIEAKSKKPFIGDIVRQINFYKSMTSENAIFILISPDILNDKEILSEQGILSFNYC